MPEFISIQSEEAMLAFGAALSHHIPSGAVIFLHGDLGAGKTTLVRGVLRGLGYTGKVKSPTYTLVEPYHLANGMLYHFDLYRLKEAGELEFMGIEEYFSPATITLIEWPDKGSGFLPAADLDCYLEFQDQARRIRLIAHSEKGQKIISAYQV